MNVKQITLILVILVIIVGGIWLLPRFKPERIGSPLLTAEDSLQRITFKYPNDVRSSYVLPVKWPPQVIVMNVPFSCIEAGMETGSVGETKIEMVDDREYCVTKIAQEVAGSVYTQYTYAFPIEGKQIIFSFSLRNVQCGNFEGPQRIDCEENQSSFSMNLIIDSMAQTLKEY